VFRPKIEEISSPKRQNFTSVKNNITLSWACEPADLSETDDEDFLRTTHNMSEIGDPVCNNKMIGRKIKKCYSTTLDNDDSFD
jgi:hypothetical protein